MTTTIETKELEAISWEQSLSHNCGNESLVKDLYKMFKEELPLSKDIVEQAWQRRDTVVMRKELHKLQGSCCYCAAPSLKAHIMNFQKMLEQIDIYPNEIAEGMMTGFKVEVDNVLAAIEADPRIE